MRLKLSKGHTHTAVVRTAVPPTEQFDAATWAWVGLARGHEDRWCLRGQLRSIFDIALRVTL